MLTEEINPLTRKDGETDLDYHKRLVYGKLEDHTLSEYEYDELAPYVYGKDYSTDVARRMMYGSCRTLRVMEKEIEDGVISKSAPDIVDEYRAKKEELRKERYKLQCEKNEYFRRLREDAKDELFEEKVIRAIEESVGAPIHIENIKNVERNREAVLCIADCHFGKEFKIYGLHGEIINQYSPETFYMRMNNVLNETVDYLKKEGITSLHVYNLGDSVDGFLRNSQAWSLRYGVIDSAITYGNYMAKFLQSLSKYVKVTYFQTDGNHDELRLLDGKKSEHLCESAGKIILNIIKITNNDNPNFTCVENRTGFIYDTVAGFNILGIHGEVTNLEAAIDDYRNVYDDKLSYIVAGHKHSAQFSNCGAKKGCIGVGSIVGTDDFSLRIRKSADASASIIIFEEEKGKTDEHTLVLN